MPAERAFGRWVFRIQQALELAFARRQDAPLLFDRLLSVTDPLVGGLFAICHEVPLPLSQKIRVLKASLASSQLGLRHHAARHLDRIPPEDRRWLAQQALRDEPDEQIVRLLERWRD